VGKKECFAFLFCLILCYSLFQHTVRAQSSSHFNISSQGSINYTPSNVNLAVIPDDWGDYAGNIVWASGTPQLCFLDTTVERTVGNPSIRLEPNFNGCPNSAREVDGKWYTIKPGDHIVAKCWMRVLTGPLTYGYPYCGGRIGIDFYGGSPIQLLYAGDFWNAYYGGDVSKGYVQDSNGGAWQQRTIDIVVPATVPDVGLSRNNPGTLVAPKEFVLWVQGAPWIIDPTASNVWFADAELYINPA